MSATLGALLVPASALASGWSSPIPVDSSFAAVSVSCPSTSFCVAVDSEQAAIYNGVSWTSPGATTIDTVGHVASVSCTSSTFCVAVDDSGHELTYNGTAWSTPATVDQTNFLDSVSCAPGTVHFCVAVDGVGNALTLHGTTWATPDGIDHGNGLDSVSCTSSTFCVAVDSAGNALTFTGTTTWAKSAIDGTNVLASVSCTSTAFCAAVDFEGDGLIFNGSSWSSTQVDPGVNIPFSVSCVSSSFCTAIDTSANAFVYIDGIWTAPASIDPGAKLLSVACPAVTFCTTIDSGGNALIYSISGPPVNASSPGITGSATQGATLTDVHGTWTNSPLLYGYQWEDCDASGASCTPIAGAVGQNYTLGAADVGHTIRVAESTANGAGSSSAPASSPATAVVVVASTPPPAATAPVNVTVPVVVNTPATVGRVLGCSGGSWSGSTPQTYTYQWLRTGVAISGATGQYYTVTSADTGNTLACRVTATNVAGSAAATSAAVSVTIPPVVGKIGTSRVGKATVSGTTAAVHVSCAGAASQKCTITLKMTIIESVRAGKIVALSASTKTTHRTVSVGSRTVTLVGGHSETVHLKLTAAGRKLLSEHHKLSVKFVGTRRTSTGSAFHLTTQTITFK
jgi:hypothetical protein